MARRVRRRVLRPRATVTVKGVGKTTAASTTSAHVTHRFTADGYVQRFKVKRNALGLTGNERFTAVDGGVIGALAGRRDPPRKRALPSTPDQLERVVARLVERVERRFYGKYRGLASWTTRTRCDWAGCGCGCRACWAPTRSPGGRALRTVRRLGGPGPAVRARSGTRGCGPSSRRVIWSSRSGWARSGSGPAGQPAAADPRRGRRRGGQPAGSGTDLQDPQDRQVPHPAVRGRRAARRASCCSRAATATGSRFNGDGVTVVDADGDTVVLGHKSIRLTDADGNEVLLGEKAIRLTDVTGNAVELTKSALTITAKAPLTIDATGQPLKIIATSIALEKG